MSTSKSQAVRISEAILRAIETIRHQAGPQKIDQMTALHWMAARTKITLTELKEGIRNDAFKKLKDDKRVPITGQLGTAQVMFMRPSVQLTEEADLDRLREILGDRFEEFFKIAPEQIEPVPAFSDRLDDYDGPQPIRDLLEVAVTYSPRPARVNPPRAPKV